MVPSFPPFPFPSPSPFPLFFPFPLLPLPARGAFLGLSHPTCRNWADSQRTANPQIVPISVKKTEFSDHNYCCAGIFWPTHQVSMARCICPKLILRTGARNPCFSTRNPCDHPHCHASADMPPPPRDVNMACPTTASNVYSLCVWATQRARYEVRAACGALSRVYRRGVDFEPSCTGMWCANECRSEHNAPISHGEISCRTHISWNATCRELAGCFRQASIFGCRFSTLP